jgi:hypothetical protein
MVAAYSASPVCPAVNQALIGRKKCGKVTEQDKEQCHGRTVYKRWSVSLIPTSKIKSHNTERYCCHLALTGFEAMPFSQVILEFQQSFLPRRVSCPHIVVFDTIPDAESRR